MANWINKDSTVTRMLAGAIPVVMKVTELTESRIICGAWEFDRETGHEIDDDIPCLVSYLIPAR